MGMFESWHGVFKQREEGCEMELLEITVNQRRFHRKLVRAAARHNGPVVGTRCKRCTFKIMAGDIPMNPTLFQDLLSPTLNAGSGLCCASRSGAKNCFVSSRG